MKGDECMYSRTQDTRKAALVGYLSVLSLCIFRMLHP